MKFGTSFPTTEIGNDRVAIRDYFQSIEEIGFDFVTMPEHVLGAGTPIADDWRAYYTRDNPFHEPFVLYGFAAAVTTRLELATAILILPQRQTALVAKQAAELDMLSGGRCRLGVGLGWNPVEFEVLNENFADRSQRIEEQIEVMRRLWTEELVTFNGQWHHLEDVGINPMPVQRPIPIWFGAFQPNAIRRAGRLSDGWHLNPRLDPDGTTRDLIDMYRTAALEAGRDAGALGLDITIWSHQGGPNEWRNLAVEWQQLGISHVTFRTMQSGHTTPDAHIEAAREFHHVIADL